MTPVEIASEVELALVPWRNLGFDVTLRTLKAEGKGFPWTDARRDVAVTLSRRGLPIGRIAALLGLNHSSVHHLIRSASLLRD